MPFNPNTAGILLYILYPLVIITITLLIRKHQEMTLNNYFFYSSGNWLLTGFSVLTALILSPFILSLTSFSFFGIIIIYGTAALIIPFLSFKFYIPEFIKNQVNTLPEFFEKKYNRKCRLYISSVFLISNVLLKLSIIVAVLKYITGFILGDSSYSLLLFFILLTGIYIIVGGTKAELYTNIVHIIFITAAAIGFTAWLLYQQPDPGSLLFKDYGLLPAHNLSPEFFNISTAAVFLLVMLFLFSDSLVVQKMVSIKNFNISRKAIIFTQLLLLVPVMISLSVLLFPASAAVNLTAASLSENFNPGSLPAYLKGLLLLGGTAILMSSSSALLNNTSALLTYDLYKTLKPGESDRKLVLVARLSSTLLLFISILVVHITSNTDYSFIAGLFRIFCFFAAVTAAIFTCTLFIKNISPSGVIFSLLSSAAIIILRIILNVFSGTDSSWFVSSGFPDFSISIFLYCSISLIIYNRVTSTVKSFGKYLSIGSVKK